MTLEVHPAAAVFPMLTDEQLDDLAADIKANGLIHPIVRTPDGLLLDGRNRFEACRRAGVHPDVETYNGDPVAYVLSANEHRRHLTPSQRAMLHVCVDKYLSTRDGAESVGISQPMIVHARKVAEHAPDLIDAVIAGTIPVKRAADEADRRRLEQDRLTAATVDDQRWLDYVRRTYPDLAEAYQQERMNRDEVQDRIDGIEQNAITQPKLVVDQVVVAWQEFAEHVRVMRQSAERWPLGTHARRLPTADEFAAIIAVIFHLRDDEEDTS